MANNPENRTDLFIVRYNIGTGAANLRVDLAVNAVDHAITGQSRVTQAINPPTDVRSRLYGDFTYMTTMPKQTHTLVTATGVLALWMPPNTGIGPALPCNLSLRMVLSADWQSGIAHYKYLVGDTWHEVHDAPVKVLEEHGTPPPVKTSIPLYAVALQQAVVRGDLAEMRRLETEAEAHLSRYEDVQSALATLRTEIARAERKA